ncbi:nuclear transport factor 2 family protein [Geodermatophilus sp. TF02-6]|uniref:nuclear transport factor 2 family protein n=1 Tax=Geodermatophilus sp. TF02-6 TaxID=2250575 RepID=UPI000DEAE098|nr:nuclear transport factor 2 family protein [Geodermatophilus sp. TF02-6]RBY83675.1 nuclear transport factor 2 family protein [Geodermatophilus sp. TF02-6]
MTDDPALLAVHSARLYHRYAKAVDDGDLDALRAMVTEDVEITRGDAPTERGVEAFLDVYRAHNALRIPVCQHVVTNVLAQRARDAGATGAIETSAYFQATMLEEQRTRVVIGSYADVHVERDGELKLAHKRIRVDRVLHLPAASASFVHVGREPS